MSTLTLKIFAGIWVVMMVVFIRKEIRSVHSIAPIATAFLGATGLTGILFGLYAAIAFIITG